MGFHSQYKEEKLSLCIVTFLLHPFFSVPRIPWAFAMTEVCGVILCYIWLLVLLLHKHRYST